MTTEEKIVQIKKNHFRVTNKIGYDHISVHILANYSGNVKADVFLYPSRISYQSRVWVWLCDDGTHEATSDVNDIHTRWIDKEVAIDVVKQIKKKIQQ